MSGTTSDLFVKTYSDLKYRFPVMVRHNGVVLAFAMDDARRIHYTVLDFGPGGSMSVQDADHWSPNPQPLGFATEIASVGIGAADQYAVAAVRQGSTVAVPPGQPVRPDETDPFLSSTARFSAATPFQVLSDDRYLYLFRQAITDPTAAAFNAAQLTLLDAAATPASKELAREVVADHQNMAYVTDSAGQPVLDAHGRQVPVVAGTLLVDRFVLVGTVLEAKLEVRYQRSRSRTRPAGSTDSLGAADLNKVPFVEPTQNLRFVPSITQGRFAAALVPTQVADVSRWQLFTHDALGDLIWSYSIERTADGLFDTLGSQPLTCTDHPDLYAVTAGTCPRPSLADPTMVCGKALVAKIPDGGASGTALSFPTAGSGVVTVNGGNATGAEFTVEAWISPDGTATGERTVISCSGDPKSSGPSIWLPDPQSLRIGFGDGQAFHDVSTPPLLTPGNWNHLAVTYSAGLLQVYVNGYLNFGSTAFGTAVPSPTPITAFGAPSGGYAGLLDDVRVWSVALAAEDIQAGRFTTLTGLEAGLVGYWRFDEGSGTTTWDSASHAKAMLDGPSWVTSDAPIATAAGLSRTPLRTIGRSVTGGMSTTIYYQQENAVSGYAGAQPSPLKQAARLMLSAVTNDTANPGALPMVVAVDFGVGVDGTLAQLPGETALSELQVPGAPAGGGGNALGGLLAAQADVASLTLTVSQDTAALVAAQSALSAVVSTLAGSRTAAVPPQYPEISGAVNSYLASTTRLTTLQSDGQWFDQPLLPALIAETQNQIQAERAQLQTMQTGLLEQIGNLTSTVANDQVQLAAAQATVTSLGRLLNGNTLLTMPLLHVDASGLTTSGAVLGFAPAVDTPVLFDSALGRVTLYFRDANDEFLLAYYDTFTGRAALHLPADTGETTFVAKSAAAELDDLTVEVSGGPTDATCSMSVSLPGDVGITETWNALPRDAVTMASILNGTTQPVFLGTLTANSGTLATLTLTSPLTLPVPEGSLLRAGTQLLTTTTPAGRGATTLTVNAEAITIADATPVYRVAYDYASASSTRAGADLRGGSLLVGVDARSAGGQVQLGSARPLGATPSCQWFAAPPGTTVDFNGATTHAGVLANTAARFNGTSGFTVSQDDDLNVTGTITVQAWVRSTGPNTGYHNIVAHGFVLEPAGEVYLRILNGNYQVGSWNGTDHVVSVPVPAADNGTWVHLTGVYDGTSWNLYRNGLLLGSSIDPTGAVEVAAGWAVGTTADGDDRFFTGDIDDIRIWNRPLGPQEITDGMSRRLAGTEAGLVAYLYMDRGALIDHDATPAATGTVGTPTQVTSPPPLARLTGFDVTGDMSMETWTNPTGAGLGRIVVHQSDAASYGLALRQRGTALHFDGTAGHGVTLPTVPALAVSGPITLEAWVRPSATDGIRDIVAHGYTSSPAAEVYLRIINGSYQVGVYTNSTPTDPVVAFPVPAGDLNQWVHLAAAFDGTAWHLYRNGIQVGTTTNPRGAIPVAGSWTIGNSLPGDRPFAGDIDEVRIWTIGRSAADIAAGMHVPLHGTEPSLAGVWRYDGQVLRDGTPGRHDGVVTGLSVAYPGPNPVYSVIATVGNQGAETTQWVPGSAWTHIAATFEQFYGVQVATGGYLDAGDAASLNLAGDLTIEAGIRIDDLSAPHGIITRGVLDDGTTDNVPYSLWVAGDGSITLAFEDKSHGIHQFSSAAGVLTPGTFRRIGVTRRHNVQVDTSNAGAKGGTAVVSSWYDITFYADGAQIGAVQRYDGPDVGSSEGSTLIGRAFGPGSATLGLRGALSEVRLWSAARDANVIGAPITGKEVGLVSWWRMQDGTGNLATDSKAGQHATLHGAVSWVHTPDGRGSTLTLYLNGIPVAATPLRPASLAAAADQFTLGALGNAVPAEFFQGQLEELRIWRTTRTAQQVQDNLFGRLTGELPDLVAYYPFAAGAMVEDNGLRGNDLLVTDGRWVLSTAPIGEDTPQARNAVLSLPSGFNGLIAGAPVAAEYAALETDVTGATIGILKRSYAYIDSAGSWQLVTGFKVGDLTTQWVGQAQFDPQLIGYLEGAPPVPSENLTLQDSYTGTSSVTLTEATTSTYTYASTRDSGFNATFELGVGQGAQEQSFVGLLELEAPLGIGVGEIELTSAVDVGVTVAGKASFETSLSWLNDTSIGQGTTATKVSSLQLTGNKETTPAHPSLGARFVPNNNGFALVQSQTADVFALRLAHTGVLVAYQMKPNPDIPKDYNVITFPIDPHYTKQGVLDGKVGGDVDVDYPNALNYNPDISYYKPIEAYGLKTQIQQQEQQLATLYAQHNVDPNQLSGGQLPDMAAPLKLDLVNNYVWTADGGQFAETTSTLDTYSETVGGAYHFQGLAGGTVSADVSIFGVALNFELSAMFGGHLDLSVTKTMDSQKSFEVDVTAGGEQDITTLDGRGQHVKAAGKVDAYRWLTFYLSPRPDNYDAFYNQVVDPIWLAQSTDPAAAALRQARQDGKRPAAWRVLHRVTYVSRVLAPVGTTQPPLDQALASLNIASNYELIRTLEPFVRGRTANYPDFAAAVRNAVTTYLPDLLPHIDDILTFTVLYYGVNDAPALNGA